MNIQIRKIAAIGSKNNSRRKQEKSEADSENSLQFEQELEKPSTSTDGMMQLVRQLVTANLREKTAYPDSNSSDQEQPDSTPHHPSPHFDHSDEVSPQVRQWIKAGLNHTSKNS